MANYPKKTIDPTEAALSAIQEALNIRDEDEDHTPAAEPAAEVPADALIDYGPAAGTCRAACFPR